MGGEFGHGLRKSVGLIADHRLEKTELAAGMTMERSARAVCLDHDVAGSSRRTFFMKDCATRFNRTGRGWLLRAASRPFILIMCWEHQWPEALAPDCAFRMTSKRRSFAHLAVDNGARFGIRSHSYRRGR